MFTVETTKFTIAVAISALMLTTAPACGSDDNDGGSGGTAQCPAGQLFSPTTQKCVDDPSVDAGSSGSSSGGSSGGGADVEKELPFALADGGGLAKDTSGAPDPWWDCPPEKLNPNGKMHGEKCEKDSDCLYGRCFVGGPLTGYNNKIKFCTKNNGCGSGNLTSCSVDNGNGKFYFSVFERSAKYPNPKRDPSKDVHKMCAVGCKSNSDCAKINPELPHCLKSGNKYVSFGTNPLCGVDPDK